MSESGSSPSLVQLREFQLQGSQYSRFLPESDCLPYYVFARTNVAPAGCGTRKFQFHQGSSCLLIEVFPARRVDPNTGHPRPVFPGEREQLVAAAIRAQAVSKSVGLVDLERKAEQRPAISVAFTYRALRADLSSAGHTISHGQLVESIEVLSDTRIRLMRFHKDFEASECLTYNLFSEHMSRGGKCVVTLNAFESGQILNGLYRAINYRRLMLFRSPVARWIYQYLRYEHRNAARHFGSEKVVPFVMDLDLFFIRGVIDRPKNVLRAILRVRDALFELEQHGVLQSPLGKAGFTEIRTTSPTGGRRRIESACWELWVSDRDAEEIILENSEAKYRRTEYSHLTAEERIQKTAAARVSLFQRSAGESFQQPVRARYIPLVDSVPQIVRPHVDLIESSSAQSI